MVNLGIGIPTLVADYIEARPLVLHTENGMLGVGPTPEGDAVDVNLVNAGKLPVSETPGAAYFSSSESFAMIRGGHVGVAVLGALQVDARGRVANWAVPGKPILGVGGAMDLLVGAQRVIVATTHVTKQGEPKLVAGVHAPADRGAAGRPDRHRARDVRGARRRARARRGRAGHRRASGSREHTAAAYEEEPGMSDALIVDAVRTPFGRHGGGLAPVRPDDLAAHVAARRCSSAPACRRPRSRTSCSAAPTRRARTTATSRAWRRCSPGFPESVGGATVNRLCGSGMDAIASAARAIRLGEAGAYVAGGVESMSRAPFVVPKAEPRVPDRPGARWPTRRSAGGS